MVSLVKRDLMNGWHDVGVVSDLSDDAPIAATIGENEIGLYQVGDRYYAAHGDTFYCALEFAKDAQKAQCSTSYGNSSQPGSPHLADQLPLMTAKKLIPVWRERKDIEAHLEKRERF